MATNELIAAAAKYQELVTTQQGERAEALQRLHELCSLKLKSVATIEDAYILWHSSPLQSRTREFARRRWERLVAEYVLSRSSFEEVYSFYKELRFPYGSKAGYALVSMRLIQLAPTLREARKCYVNLGRGNSDRRSQFAARKRKEAFDQKFDAALASAATCQDLWIVYKYGVRRFGWDKRKDIARKMRELFPDEKELSAMRQTLNPKPCDNYEWEGFIECHKR